MKTTFWLCVMIMLCAGCGSVSTARPTHSPVPSSPTITLAPTESKTPSVYDQLNTRSVELHQTATLQALSFTPTPTRTSPPTPLPTFSLLLYAPQPVESHPLALTAKNAGQMQMLRRIGDGYVNDLAWSPDGKYLAAACELGVQLYDALNFQPVRLLAIESPAWQIAFRPDGKALVIISSAAVAVWDVASGERMAVMEGEIPGRVLDLAYGTDNLIAISAGDQFQVEGRYNLLFWDAATGKIIDQELAFQGRNFLFDLSVETHSLFYWGHQGPSIRDLVSGQSKAVILDYAIENAVFSPDGLALIAAHLGADPWLIAYRLADGYTIENREIRCDRLLRSGQMILCAEKGLLRLIDPATLKEKLGIVLPLPPSYASMLVPDANGRLAWLQNDGNGIGILDRSDAGFHSITIIERLAADIPATGILKTGGRQINVAAGANQTGDIRIWDLESGEVITDLHGSDARVVAMAFSPDLRSLAWMDEANHIFWWDVIEAREIHRYTLKDRLGNNLVFSPDNTHLLLLDPYRQVLSALDLRTGAFSEIRENPNLAPYAAMLPYPAISASSQGHLLVWRRSAATKNLNVDNLTTGEQAELPFPALQDSEEIKTIAVSKDGNLLVIITNAPRIAIWDLHARGMQQTFALPTQRISTGWEQLMHLAFSPAMDLLVSKDNYMTTRLWNINTGEEVRRINAWGDASFTPDGRYLVTSSMGVIRVWGIAE